MSAIGAIIRNLYTSLAWPRCLSQRSPQFMLSEITLVVLGKKWIDAAPLLMIFSLAAFIRPVLGTSGVVLITCGHSKRLLVFALVRNATLALLTFVAIHWGAEGVAVGQLATLIVLTLPCLYYSFAQSPVTVATFFNAIRTPLIASAVMVAAITIFRSFTPEIGPLAALCSGLGVGAAAYLGVCVLLPESRRELTTLLKALYASFSLRRLRVSGETIPAFEQASTRPQSDDSHKPMQLLRCKEC